MDWRAEQLGIEDAVIRDADLRASTYLRGGASRRAYPSSTQIAALEAFDEALPETGWSAAETLRLLDEIGSPATVHSNGPRYFGFVIGALLPAPAAAERLMLAWDQNAASPDSSPAAAAIEKIAGRWILDILDLPRDSTVGFGTSATACTIACISAARRALLAKAGWDFDANGLSGAPEVRVVISETTHVAIRKALRLLGFGEKRLITAPIDEHGRFDPSRLPTLDARTILCLQAGEVNTGEFDRFSEIMPQARAAGAWVHVDGAFGLWARASSRRALTDDVEEADSWTCDGHKWLNTPYDGAMAICRNGDALAQAMHSSTAYAPAARDAQMNLTLEFSRRARGIPIWAALRTLGRSGVADLVDRHCDHASQLAQLLAAGGLEILNRVVLNQVLVRHSDDRLTNMIREKVCASGEAWFGPTVWRGRPAFRLSVSSWRTDATDIEHLAYSILRACA